MNFFQEIASFLIGSEPFAVELVETKFPKFAPYIALADGLYQAEERNPGALQAGLTIPVDIKGAKLQVTVGPRPS